MAAPPSSMVQPATTSGSWRRRMGRESTVYAPQERALRQTSPSPAIDASGEPRPSPTTRATPVTASPRPRAFRHEARSRPRATPSKRPQIGAVAKIRDPFEPLVRSRPAV